MLGMSAARILLGPPRADQDSAQGVEGSSGAPLGCPFMSASQATTLMPAGGHAARLADATGI